MRTSTASNYSQIARSAAVGILGAIVLMAAMAAFPRLEAADLKPAFTLNDGRVLPSGVRRVSYKNMLLSADQKFGDAGYSVTLADPLFRQITFRDILLGTKDPAERGSLEQVMLSMGADEGDTFGSTTGQVNINTSVHVPILSWGLGKKLTVAMALPFVQASINVDSGVIQENSGLHASFINTLNEKGVTEKIVEFQDKMSDPIRSKLRDYGYKELVGENVTHVGDLKLVSKYHWVDNPRHRLSLMGELTLPVGEEKDVDKALNVTLGDGQTDIGLGVHYDVLLRKTLTLALGASYTAQLPDRNAERVPEQEDTKVTPDVDGDLQRNLGDIVTTQVGLLYARGGWGWQLGHSYQYKGEDEYRGTRFASERYAWIGRETEQEMHSLVLGANYNTIELFRAKKFPLPMMVSLNHTRVLAGRNVVRNPLTALDISVFF